MISHFFIDRPIFASVLSIVFVLAGGVTVFTLPVAQYPEVTPPTVLVTALGVGTFLAAVNVRYRDVKYVLPFLIQVWMFASPVVYTSTLIPAQWHVLYALNPMTGVIQGFRWALLGSAPNVGPLMILAVAIVMPADGPSLGTAPSGTWM